MEMTSASCRQNIDRPIPGRTSQTASRNISVAAGPESEAEQKKIRGDTVTVGYFNLCTWPMCHAPTTAQSQINNFDFNVVDSVELCWLC